MPNRLRRRDDGSSVAAGAVLDDRLLDRVQQIPIANGLGQELDAPAFMARTDIGTSVWPLMKIIGKSKLALASSS